ncbi:MAG: SpoIID/LytB domain-containing protein [Bacteroidota bacterium]
MKEPLISVGILSSNEIRFDLYGDFLVESSEKKASGKFKAVIDSGKIKVYQEKKEISFLESSLELLYYGDEIFFSPNDLETESFLLRDVIIGKNFHWEKKENQRFRGSLKLIKEKDKITAINILPLEEYLTSVISSEMSSNSSIELLKAHAIVSRGWLLAQLTKKNKKAVNEIDTDKEIIRWYDREEHANFDFCADDHCQRYQGVTKIVNDNAFSTIEATRGLVLKYGDEICDTRYSKCCGGITEAFENVWEPVLHPYLSSIVDYKFEPDGHETDLTGEKSAEQWIKSSPNAFCNTSDKKILSQILVDFDRDTNDFFRWKVEYTQDEIAGIIKTKSGIDFGNIIDLIPLKRGWSGRIITLKIRGTNKTLSIGKELEIRRTLSPTHLYSSAFVAVRENIVNGIPQKFILYGAGWGHGVGFCQIGAAVMGELGYCFDEILIHYFKNTTIHKIY